MKFDIALSDLYARLLNRRRILERWDLSGVVRCKHCKTPKHEHLSDGRCTAWVLSKAYESAHDEERKRIEQAIVKVEKLNELLEDGVIQL